MFLCVGTTPALSRTMIFDRFATDDVNRATGVEVAAAGKAINVARALHSIGERPLCTGFLAGDSGRAIRADLDAAGIAHDFVELTGPETRVCVTIVDRSSSAATELIQEPTPVSHASSDELLKLIAAKLHGGEHASGAKGACHAMILSGSLVPGVPFDFYGRCCALAEEHKIPVVVDARDAALVATFAHRPAIVKHNRSELASTLDRAITSDNDLRKAVWELVARGPGGAVITLGKRGAIASNGTSIWIAELDAAAAKELKIVSPIGSGDAFAAGLAAALFSQKQSLPEALALASACGIANALHPQAGHVERAAVDRLREFVRVSMWT